LAAGDRSRRNGAGPQQIKFSGHGVKARCRRCPRL
jgi:hypothetical protein